MNNNWKKLPIQDVCESIIDCLHATAPSADEMTPYRMIRTSNIKSGRINTLGMKCVTKGTYEKWTRRGKLKRGDVILTREAPMGEVGMIRTNEKFFLGQRLVQFKADTKKIDEHFLLYSFQGKDLQDQIKSLGAGATVEHLNVPDAKKLTIFVPKIEIQRKIVSIILAYENLIEINNQRIKNLEEIAQTIYNEWFIKLKFPNHQDEIMSESELGLIPEKWEIQKLIDYVDFVRGVEPGSKNYVYEKSANEVPFLRVGDLGSRNSGIFIDKTLTKGKMLSKTDIAITLDGTVGIVKMGLVGCYSTGIRKILIKNKRIKPSFLFFLMKSDHIQNIIRAHAKGTTILHAGQSVKHMDFILPPEEIIKNFDEIVGPILSEILILGDRNLILQETRDLILPKLISGEIDVENMEIITEGIKT